MKKLISTALFLLSYTLVIGCGTIPVNTLAINPSANATAEVNATNIDLESARQSQIDLLAPEKFLLSEKSFRAAEKSLESKKTNSIIFTDLAESRAWLEQARIISQKSTVILAKPMAARASALSIIDRTNKEILAVDNALASSAKKIENGEALSDKNVAALTESYVDAERARLTRTQLDPIENRLEQARSISAKKLAPTTYAHAEQDFIAAQKILKLSPYEKDQVLERIQTSQASSIELLEIARQTAKTSSQSPENLVLANRKNEQLNKEKLNTADERFQKAVQSNSQFNQENENLKAAVNTLKDEAEPQAIFQKLRRELPEDKAEILMTPSGQVMIRLKELQFKSNSAELSSSAASVLVTVRTSLADIDPKKLTIAGHTDSIGSVERNKTLSASRAMTVATVLKTDNGLSHSEIETIGLGAEKPLKNNTSKEGRAENRRVEITIEKF
ncbi:MAG: OmpA family protein [Pseudobdellovibrio sp.]